MSNRRRIPLLGTIVYARPAGALASPWAPTASEYQALGGVQQAIARTADVMIYKDLPRHERRGLQPIFLRLTHLGGKPAAGEEQRDIRRRVRFEELVPARHEAGETKQLVTRLADARLLVTSVNPATGHEEVEVAHEALIRYWPRLEDNRDRLRLRQRIGQEAWEWEAGGRQQTLLPLVPGNSSGVLVVA